MRYHITDGADQTRLVFRSLNSGELLSDLDGRLLERRWRIFIVGLEAEEVHDAFGVGHDVSLDGLVVGE